MPAPDRVRTTESMLHPSKALRAMCETLLDYPEGIDEGRLRARLGLPAWLYDDVTKAAVESALAEAATVFVGHAFVLPGRQLPGREKAGLRPTDKTKAFVLGESDDTEAGEDSVPSGRKKSANGTGPNKRPGRPPSRAVARRRANIKEFLEQNPKASRADLADQFAVNRRTIGRDLEALGLEIG